MKFCGKCQKWKDESDFSSSRKKKGGLSSNCKDCHAAYHGKWYQENRRKRIAQVRVVAKAQIAENGKRVDEYLRSHSCVDCGESDIIVLEFDHVRGQKKGDVSRFARNAYSWEVIENEIAKCEVRCANCHRRVTAMRRLECRRVV